jgi:lysophospholipid acyltransferase
MYTDFGGYNMDVRTYTMLLMIKLWGLTFAYKDGGEPIENLTKDQIERRVVNLPNPLQYFSYVFFCCGCLMGPFFEFNDFINWI